MASLFASAIRALHALIWHGLLVPLAKIVHFFIKDIVWTSIVYPTGVIGAQLVFLLIKSIWYGPFATRQILHDGLLGAPRTSVVLRYPFQVWIPTTAIATVFGTVFGLGLGMRNYFDLLFTLIRSAWWGIDPRRFYLPDGLLVAPTPPDPLYKSEIGRIFAVVTGVVGFRALLQAVTLIIPGIWYGVLPRELSIKDAPWLCAKPKDWSSLGSQLFGLLGLGLGLRFFVSVLVWIASCLWYGPNYRQLELLEWPMRHFVKFLEALLCCCLCLGQCLLSPIINQDLSNRDAEPTWAVSRAIGVLGCGVGLRQWVQYITYVPVAAWYGGLANVTVAGYKLVRNPDRPTVPKSWGARALGIVFGLVLGLRNWIRLIAHLAVVVCVHGWAVLRGAWFGVGLAVHCSDGWIAAPKPERYPTTGSDSVSSRLAFYFGAMTLGGLGLGVYNWANMVTVLLLATFYGALDLNIAFGKLKFKSSRRTMKTIPGRTLGVVFGLVVGWRNIVQAICIAGFAVVLVAWYIARGAYFGLVPTAQVRYGMLSKIDDSNIVYKSRVRHVWGAVGSVLGLGIGWRWILNLGSAILWCSWYGGTAWGLSERWSVLGPHRASEAEEAAAPNRIDPVRVVLSVPGLVVGWRAMIDALLSAIVLSYLTLASAVVRLGRGLVWATVNAKACAIHLGLGAWYGAAPSLFYCRDGLFDPPPILIATSSNVEFIRWAGSVFGLFVGWRNVLNTVSIILPAFWSGCLPGNVLFPDGVLKAMSDDISALHVIVPEAESIPPSPVQPAVPETKPSPPSSSSAAAALTSVPLVDTPPPPPPPPPPATAHDDAPVPPKPRSPGTEMTTPLGRVFGLVFGLGIGFKRVLDALSIMAMGFWVGAAPKLLDIPDSPLHAHLGVVYEYQHWTGHFLGGISGLGFGLRFWVLFLAAAAKGMWYGVNPRAAHSVDGLLSVPSATIWSNISAGIVFGVFGAGVGLRAVVNAVTVIPFAMWYGAIGMWYLDDGILGKPRKPMTTWLGRAFGVVFGLVAGLRTFVDVLAIAIQGFWWGCFPVELTLHDALLGGQLPAYKVPSKVVRAFGVFGAVIGMRQVMVVVFYIPFALWYGAYPEFFQLPEPFTFMNEDIWFNQTRISSRILGAVFGGIIGVRLVLDFVLMIIYSAIRGCFSRVRLHPPTNRPRHPYQTQIYVRHVFSALFIAAVCGVSVWKSRPQVDTMCIAAAAAAGVGALIGLQNLINPIFYWRAGKFLADAVLIVVGVALYLPLFLVVLLVTHQARTVRWIVQYATSTTRGRYRPRLVRAVVAIILTWGAFTVACIAVRRFTGLSLGIALAVGAGAAIVTNFAVAMAYRFTEAIVLGGWPMADADVLLNEEKAAVVKHLNVNMRLAQRGLRSDPLGPMRFYIRDFGLISPDERKLKVMRDLFLEADVVVQDMRGATWEPAPPTEPHPAGEPGPRPPSHRTSTAAPSTPSSQASAPASSDEPPPSDAISPASLSPTSDTPPDALPDAADPLEPPLPTTSTPPPHAALDAFPDMIDPQAPALPSFAEAMYGTGAAAPAQLAPEYESLEPVAVPALDEATATGVFALHEVVPMPNYVLELRFPLDVSVEMIARGFKPRQLLVVKRERSQPWAEANEV
ncbi:hypothetical protein, variant [Allomyces macrogynus ATCC 38327]|uniref:Uncharacterized protein n=1 Tax=Allomyces macrogynus (strain ATCC 38327) TaxID=578462 RepID=A0A0L0S4J8_ALLM3|nr:hypothetical protein, variant [Allomyces macrogynus ATCC 38327]|eukprot:KNE57341.1 hypothetical protein, variant [Allomyces macrogynus ATCC 38327]